MDYLLHLVGRDVFSIINKYCETMRIYYEGYPIMLIGRENKRYFKKSKKLLNYLDSINSPCISIWIQESYNRLYMGNVELVRFVTLKSACDNTAQRYHSDIIDYFQKKSDPLFFYHYASN